MRLGPTVSRCIKNKKTCKRTVELTIANKLRFKHEKKYFTAHDIRHTITTRAHLRSPLFTSEKYGRIFLRKI